MRHISVLFLITASCLFAANPHCSSVGGGITTNFIDASTTLGSATGDLAGGLGVSVLGQNAQPNGNIVLTVHHHWVTQTGDTFSLDQAQVTLFPTSIAGVYFASYLSGINVNGSGTGRFGPGASGTIYAWGAVDLNKLQLTLRYSGQVCYAN